MKGVLILCDILFEDERKQPRITLGFATGLSENAQITEVELEGCLVS
jgi:hypothetical protein